LRLSVFNVGAVFSFTNGPSSTFSPLELTSLCFVMSKKYCDSVFEPMAEELFVWILSAIEDMPCTRNIVLLQFSFGHDNVSSIHDIKHMRDVDKALLS
jgi:hypothetical protein